MNADESAHLLLLQMFRTRNLRDFGKWVDRWTQETFSCRCVCLCSEDFTYLLSDKRALSQFPPRDRFNHSVLPEAELEQLVAPVPRRRCGFELFHLDGMKNPSCSSVPEREPPVINGALQGTHGIGVEFRRHNSVIVVLLFVRARGEPVFSAEEERKLRSALPCWREVLWRLMDDSREAVLARAIRTALLESEDPLILADPEGRIQFINTNARRLLEHWRRPERPVPALTRRSVTLPPELFHSVRRLARCDATEKGARTGAPCHKEVPCPAIPQWTASLHLQRGRGPRRSPPLIAIRFGNFGNGWAAASVPNEPPLAVHLLSRSERELVNGIREGLTNAELAARFGKSVGTVKHQLHCVFRKLDVTSRTVLLARLFSEGDGLSLPSR